MSNERPSSPKPVLVVGLIIGALALAGAFFALRPVTPQQAASPAAAPAPAPSASRLQVRPLRAKGPLPLKSIQEAVEGQQAKFRDCFAQANATCNGCLATVDSSLTLAIHVDGKVAESTPGDVPFHPVAEGTSEQALEAGRRFRTCTGSIMTTVVFPAAAETTEAMFQVTVTAASR
ncbi:MAG: hypothetical protein QM765_00435 [Myxococcales bacterium]